MWGLRLFVVALAVTAAAALTACGGDEVDSPGLATVVPVDAPLYADGVVKPDDEDREALDSSLGTLLGEPDVVARFSAGLDEVLEDEDASWGEDIEPWAGERAGIFFLDLGEDPEGAMILEIEDENAFGEATERIAARRGAVRDESHGGVDYRVDDDDRAWGVVEGYAVIGPEAGVQAAIDASQGDSLDDSDAFEAAIGDLSDDRLATVYASPGPILDGLLESGEIDAAERAQIADAFGAAGEEPIAFSLGAASEALFAEVASHSGDGSVAASASELIERAPEDAWLAFGLGDAGPALEAALATADPRSLDTGIGLDLPGFAAGAGDAGGFFAGTSLLGMTGALVLSEREPAALGDSVSELERGLADDPSVRVEPLELEGEGFALIPAGVPIQFPVVLRDGMLVVAMGTDAVSQALEPEASLSDSDAFEAAADGVGDDFEVAAYLDFEQMLQLLGSLPGFWEDPEMASARPYLERLERFVAGVREDDDRSIARAVLGVREGGGAE
jgi:hypothetical protein